MRGRFENLKVQQRMQQLTNWERHRVMVALGKRNDPKQGEVTPQRLGSLLKKIHTKKAKR